MATINDTDLARTTARAGAGRAGATRAHFAPHDVRDTAPGDTSGPLVGFVDALPDLPAPTFTTVKE